MWKDHDGATEKRLRAASVLRCVTSCGSPPRCLGYELGSVGPKMPKM